MALNKYYKIYKLKDICSNTSKLPEPKNVKILVEDNEGNIHEIEGVNLYWETKVKPLSRKNPNKHTLLKISTKYGDQIEYAWYKGKNYISCYVNAGVHNVKYFITLPQLVELLTNLINVYDKIVKAHKEWSKLQPLRVHKLRIKKIKARLKKALRKA